MRFRSRNRNSDQFAVEAAIDADVDQSGAFLADLYLADFIDTTVTDSTDATPTTSPTRLRDTSGGTAPPNQIAKRVFKKRGGGGGGGGPQT